METVNMNYIIYLKRIYETKCNSATAKTKCGLILLLNSLGHPTPITSLNEVILFRNPVIDKHNRLCANPIWAELRFTNHVSGNELDTHSASWSTYCPVFSWMLTFLCLTIPMTHYSLLPGIKQCRKWCFCVAGHHRGLLLRTNSKLK